MSILRTIKQEHYLEIYEALENDEKIYHRSNLNKPPTTTTDKENSGALQQNNIQAPRNKQGHRDDRKGGYDPNSRYD